jgi:hypothetical protein
MSPMNPRLMRPLTAGNRLPVFAAAGYTRLWAVTTQSGGNITGSAETDTGYYAVKWWDNSVDIYDSGDPFSKSAAGNQRAFEVYPCDSAGVPGGQFDGFDLSDNSLTQVRSEGVTLASSGGAPTGGFFYSGYWWQGWLSGPYFSPIVAENGIISDNLLSAEALDQFYTDLDAGTGSLLVDGNPGIDADDPTIATAKGYTVFGSVPPSTSLLLNFNGSNGSTTFTDSSPNEMTVTAAGSAAISTAQSKFGGSSVYFSSSAQDYATVASSEVFNFGTGDFTIEGWFFIENFAEYMRVFARGDWESPSAPSQIALELNSGSNGILWLGPTNEQAAVSNLGISSNTWHHIALTRSRGTARLFVDGVQRFSGTKNADVVNSDSFYIGTLGGLAGQSNVGLNGYVDDFRVLNGIALYTANFTPPASELEVYP